MKRHPPDANSDRDFAYAMDGSSEARIRAAARDAISWSFQRLRDEHVIPRSRYQPWIRMAHDYYGHAVEGSEGELSKALEAALPNRFSKSGRAADHPWSYARAIVEAAVAMATLRDEPYDVTSPAVEAVIDALIETVRRLPASTVLQVIADVDVEHEPVPDGHQDRFGETVTVGAVRVTRVGNEPETFIERELASAGYEVDRSDVFVHPEPASIFVSHSEAETPYEDRTRSARSRLFRLLTAVRLATAATAYAKVDIAGDPGVVRWMDPSITPFPGWDFRLVHRPVVLSSGDVAGLERLMALLKTITGSEGWTAVRVAVARLNRSLDGRSPTLIDQAVDLAVGMEAALAGTDKTEVSLRLRSRAAMLLEQPSDPADVIYRDVKALYDLRSSFVHGSALPEKAVDKALSKVSSTAKARWPGDQYLLVLDRWRDLLRRAILVRIALADAPHSPWPTGEKQRSRLDVDELLLRTSDRTRWREQVEAFWAESGLPQVHLEAPKPRMTMGA